MKKELWKLTFEANYPVCNGEMLFVVNPVPREYVFAEQVHEYAKKLAHKNGASKAFSKETELMYIGKLTFHRLPDNWHDFEQGILSIHTGEY